MVLFSSIITPNWRVGQINLALQRSAVKVSQDIKKAQELSLRAQQYSCAAGNIAGYGAYFNILNPSSYVIFADCNNNQKYDANVDGVIETLGFENGISMQSVSQNAFSIVFVPPEPVTSIKNEAGSQLSSAQIVLLAQGSAAAKFVTISNNGVINIQ